MIELDFSKADVVSIHAPVKVRRDSGIWNKHLQQFQFTHL